MYFYISIIHIFIFIYIIYMQLNRIYMNSMQGCFLCLLCKLLATPFGSAKRFGLQNWICCETAMTGRTFPIQNRSGIYNQLVERLHIYSTYTWICLRTQKNLQIDGFPIGKGKKYLQQIQAEHMTKSKLQPCTVDDKAFS